MSTAMVGRPVVSRSAEADAAVAELFGLHRLQMVRLAMLLVDDRETAEDVVQDAFAALHRKWPSLSSPDAAMGYLRVCVVNGSRSVLRRRRTVRMHWRNDDPMTADSADVSTILASEHQQVLDAMHRLPRRQREVIVLRYWSELSEAEIAAALGISVGAVKSTASRARDAISAMLGGER
jgi:RNA polymerase sigma-70 factor (sigma-E family)